MKDLCIVIPIYKEVPSKSDLFSINSIIEANEDLYDIIYVAPHDLDLSLYPEIYDVETFNGDFFTSTIMYSVLLREVEFYRRFNKYHYMLIYQTDCFVFYKTLFKKEISQWMNKDFDYIGAPIISNNANWDNVPVVGNGGCSLRKISKFISICEDTETYNKVIRSKKADLYMQYEDLYFCEGINEYIYLDVPSFKDAFNFAWDMNPDRIYRMGYEFPLFVHAWNKNLPFWRYHFNELSDRDDILKEQSKVHQNFWEMYYKI